MQPVEQDRPAGGQPGQRQRVPGHPPEAVLAAQEVRGRNTQVLAPDDGVISSRTATVGSVVAAGTELFRLIRQGRLEWRAEVTSAELSRIAVGTTAFVVSASGAQVRGKVRDLCERFPLYDPLM